MEIRAAILAAADHIERNPGAFDFWSTRLPGCGTPGCALGWVAHFCGFKTGAKDQVWEFAERVLKLENPYLFYDALDEICGEREWRTDASECAKAMRAYADANHPAPALTHDAGTQTRDAPRLTTQPKLYDFQALAERLAKEPRPAVAA